MIRSGYYEVTSNVTAPSMRTVLSLKACAVKLQI